MTRDRSTLTDLVLAFAVAFVITLAFWPQRTPHQLVRCRDAEGTWKTYSIPVDDPSLDDIRHKVKQWQVLEMDPQYVTAKWQKEIAEFYEKCAPLPEDDEVEISQLQSARRSPPTARISDAVVFASFETRPTEDAATVQTVAHFELTDDSESSNVSQWNDEAAPEPAVLSLAAIPTPAEALPAKALSPEALTPEALPAASLSPSLARDLPPSPTGVDGEPTSVSDLSYWATVKASAEQAMQAARIRRQDVPVVFERTTAGGWPQMAFHFAFLFGLAGACSYMHWSRRTPTVAGKSFEDQPTAVHVRIGTSAGAVALAMFCAVAVWL